MQRRSMLIIIGASATATLAGCLDDTGSNDKNSTNNEVEDQSNDQASIQVMVNNATSTELGCELTISATTETIFEEEFKIDSGGSRSIDTEITNTGQYEVLVTTNSGSEASSPFHIDEYDLSAGSNLIVEIDEETIRILMQE